MQLQRPVILAWFALACACLSQGMNVSPPRIVGDIGDTVGFTCNASGLEDVTHYYWTVNGSVVLCAGCTSDLNIPAILDGSLHLRSIKSPMLTSTINETNGGIYDCVAFNDTDYAVGTGYLFVNPVVDDQEAVNMTEVTFVCQSSFPGPDGNYQWIRDPPDAEPEVLAETGPSLTVIATTADSGTVYTCVFTANISGHVVTLSDGGLLTVYDEIVSPEGLVSVVPDHLVAVQDENVYLHCITGSGPSFQHTFQWLVNASHYLCDSSDCSQQQTYADLNSLLDAVNSGALDISVSTSRRLDIRGVNATKHGGEYDCIMSNDAGVGRGSAILYVEPYFVLHPADATAKLGETVTFTCMAESFPYPAYQWQKQQGSVFVDIFDETDTTLTVDVGYDSSGVYRCMAMATIRGTTVSNASREAVLQVSPEGSVSIIPESHTAAQNEDVGFHCITGAGPELGNSYLWLISASHYLCDSSECSQQQTYPDLNSLLDAVNSGALDISVSTTRNLDIVGVDATEHGGEYDCIVSNAVGIGRASTILYVEPYFTLHPVDVVTYHGETATFTCKAESFPYPAYRWQKQQGSAFVDMPGETGPTLTVAVGDGDSNEVYRCVAMSLILGNTFSVNSNEATLYVLTKEVISPEGMVSVIPANTIAAQDEDVQFECMTGAVPDIWNTYLWLINASHYLCDSSECSQQQTYPDLNSLLVAVNSGALDISVSTARDLDIVGVDAAEHGGEYDCIVSNDAGVGRGSAILFVKPYFTLHPVDVIVSDGESATLTCMAESFPYPAYKWQKLQGSAFVDLPDETDTTLTIDVGSSLCEVYRCVATNLILGSTFSVNSNQATVCACPEQPISPQGSVAVVPDHVRAARHDNVRFRCISDSGPDLCPNNMYLWFSNASHYLCDSSECGHHQTYPDLNSLLDAVNNGDLDISVSTGQYLDIMDVDATKHGAEYDCIVSNDVGVGRGSAILFVEPYFVLHPADATAKFGETVTFTCMAESFPYPTYQWQKQQGSVFVDIFNETDTTLTVDVSSDSSGVYRCMAMATIRGTTISNASNGAVLQVSPEGSVSAIPVRQTVAQDEDVQFQCYTPAGPDHANTYLWLSNASHYLCDSSNCNQQQTYADLNSLLDAVNSGALDISVSTSRRVDIVGVDATKHGGEYDCIVSNNAGVGRASAILYVKPYFTLHPADVSVTDRESATLTCMAESFPYPTYKWQKQQGSMFVDLPNETGTTLTVAVGSDSCEVYRCVAMSLILGNVYSVNSMEATACVCPAEPVSPEGSVAVIPEHTTAVQHENVRFRCITSPGPAFCSSNSYLWLSNASYYLCDSSDCSQQEIYPDLNSLLDDVNSGDLDITVSTSPYLDIVDVNATEHGGEYDCIVSNDAGIGTASAVLYVEPYITLSPANMTANLAETVTFTCKAESFPYPTYQWQKQQEARFVDILNKTDTTLTIAVGSDSHGVYRCAATNIILGRTFTNTSTPATLHVAPEASITVDQQDITIGDPVQLTCTASGGPMNRFTWTFNGVTVGTDPVYAIASFAPEDYGTYACTVTNAAGGDTASIDITS